MFNSFRSLFTSGLALAFAACGGAASKNAATGSGGQPGTGGGPASTIGVGSGSIGGMNGGTGGAGGGALDCTLDTDGDGITDCDEKLCGSNPLDAMSKCYACGWKHNDPGNLVSNGITEGSVIANLDLIDQCKEKLKLWDLAGEYHILFMTAAW